MKFLEKDLEDIIYSTPRESLSERGLDISGKMYRQLRIGNYGIADLVTVQKNYIEAPWGLEHEVTITVYELKKGLVNVETFLQAVRYSHGIKSFMQQRFDLNVDVDIVLIGSSIDNYGECGFIPNIFNNIKYFTYKYNYNGITFDGLNLTMLEEGFGL